MAMTTKKATIVGVVGAGLIALGLMTVPASAATVSGPYTVYVEPEITNIPGYVGAFCGTRGERLHDFSLEDQGDGHLVTYTCVAP
jgi:hypothetical protein